VVWGVGFCLKSKGGSIEGLGHLKKIRKKVEPNKNLYMGGRKHSRIKVRRAKAG